MTRSAAVMFALMVICSGIVAPVSALDSSGASADETTGDAPTTMADTTSDSDDLWTGQTRTTDESKRDESEVGGAEANETTRVRDDDDSIGSNTSVETFEDETLDDWIDVEAAEITTDTVYNGSNAVVITDQNEEMFKQNGHYTGNRIYRNGSASAPSTLSVAVRIDDGYWNDLRVKWRNATGAGIIAIDLNNYGDSRTLRINGEDVSDYSSYTWHRIELTGIDWTNHTVGTVRLDGQQVATNVAFGNPADAVTNVSVSINDGGTGSQGWVDDVTIPAGDGEAREPPNATFTYTPADPETGESVAFDATNSSTPAASITTYAWDFDGDGQTDVTGATPNHTFDSPGTYNVTLTVTDSAGGTATASRLLTVTAPSPPEPPETIGVSTGDPHIVTFDGLAYDFQAAGEFVLVDEAGGPLEVQARQVQVAGRDVTVNSAVATRLGGHNVTIDARAAAPVTVDGQPVAVNGTHPATVGNGSVFYDPSSSVYTVVYPGENGQLDDGDAQLVADVVGDRIDVTVHVDPADRGPLSGLFGSVDGQRSNDLALANGTTLDRPPAFDMLYGPYRSDWRVTNATTLFTYADGNGPGTYYRPNVPTEPTTLDDFPDAEVEDAKALARDAGLNPGTANFRNAVLDYLLTNDSSYFDSAQQAPETPDDNRTTPEFNETNPGGPVGSNTTIETFEDATLDDWIDVEAAEITTDTVYNGSNAVVITDQNEEMFKQNGHYTGNRIYRNGSASAPSTLSVAARIDDGSVNDLKVNWRNATGSAIVGIDLNNYNSNIRVNGESVTDFSSYTWYRVELTGIDWSNHTVGTVRVDGQQVATNVAFKSPADAVTNVSVSINDGGTGSQGWVDDVTVPGGGSTVPDDDPSPTSPNTSRSLSTAEVSPGENVTVTLSATATASTLSFDERFSPSVGAASITDVTVNGTTVSPLVATANGDGAVVTLDGLDGGETVEVSYEIQVSDGATNGTDYTVTGNVSAASTHTVDPDQFTVVESHFDGAAARYNTDGNDVIDIGELAAAAADFSAGEIDIAALAQVSQAFATSNA